MGEDTSRPAVSIPVPTCNLVGEDESVNNYPSAWTGDGGVPQRPLGLLGSAPPQAAIGPRVSWPRCS